MIVRQLNEPQGLMRLIGYYGYAGYVWLYGRLG